MPSVVVDSSGAPVVAFVYTTGSNAPSPPATFYIGTNSDVYAARWDGAGWLGVGPAVPTQPVGAGLGQAGGISANANASAPPGSPVAPATPSIAIGTDNRPVVAWSDNSADPNQTRVLLRKLFDLGAEESDAHVASGGVAPGRTAKPRATDPYGSVTDWETGSVGTGKPSLPETEEQADGKARKGWAFTGIAAAAVTTVLAVVVAGQVASGQHDAGART